MKKGDVIQIENGDLRFPGVVTDVTPCFVFVGKLKFRRDDRWLVKRQQKNRLRLRMQVNPGMSSSPNVADTGIML